MLKNGCRILLLLILTGLSGLNTLAHTGGNKGFIHYNLNVHAGNVLPHHATMTYLNREYLRGIELNAWFDYHGGDKTGNSVLGAGYIFSNLGNREVYGNFHAAYMSILNPPLSSILPFRLTVGLGIACATKRYDLEKNYFNRAIGSHLNAYGQITFTGKIPIVENRWILRPGISFHHLSNGRIVAPNQGINLMTFRAGLDFRSGHRHSGILAIERDTLKTEKNRFSATIAPGIKEIDRRIDKQIITSSLILDYGYRFHPEISIGVGMGFFYNDTWAWLPYTRTEKDDTLPPFQSAVHISLQRDLGPLAFFLHPGTYIYAPALDIPYFTGRLGLRYKLENNLTLHFAIKHHWFAIADYFEWGIGYEFNR